MPKPQTAATIAADNPPVTVPDTAPAGEVNSSRLSLQRGFAAHPLP